MAEDNYICDLCLEDYDLNNEYKIPKKVPCCGHKICLECLLDIYKRSGSKFNCPYCRKVTYTNPLNFETSSNVSSRFLDCLNCHRKVLQNKLYLCLCQCEGEKIKCQLKCQKCKCENDLYLSDYLPDLLKKIKEVLSEYNSHKKSDIIILLQEKIKATFEDYFKEILAKICELMTKKIVMEIKEKLNYDLEVDYENYKQKMTVLENDYKYLESFNNDDQSKTFNSKKILSCVENYDKNLDDISQEAEKFSKLRKFISNDNLFSLKHKANVEKECNYFMQNCETILADFHSKKVTNKLKMDVEDDSNIEIKSNNDKDVSNMDDESFSLIGYNKSLNKIDSNSQSKIDVSQLDKLLIKNIEQNHEAKNISKLINKKEKQ